MKITIGFLINSNDSLRKAYKADLNGMDTIRLREILKNIDSKTSLFNEARDEMIQEVNTKDLKPEDKEKEVDRLNKKLIEMSQAEVEIETDIILDIRDFQKLSVEDMDVFETLGLMALQEEKTEE
ncbi:hypothetical protein CL614_00055 [archaeon]|nr:hypothetical protein [archaeon]|tara:strand:- start:501 stop:875 length:375 start_codon:yes stop_codon:yes gene_type:complete